MKAIVCVKQVPDTQGKVAVKADGTMDRSAMATITNPDDLNAVEDALALESSDSPYVNVLVCKEGNENNAAIQALAEALHSDAVKNYIAENFDGAVIAVPNDATNEGRALLLLEAQGLITLDDSSNLTATPNNIVDNPKNLEFQELEAATIPSVLADVDLAVINSNYALGAGLNPTTDALAIESSDSPYVNVLVVKEGNENNEAIQALVDACLLYTSPSPRDCS